MIALYVFLGFALLIMITRPFTILLHELGHALTIMLLKKEGATIFVGSFGDEKYSLRIKIRQLRIRVHYNPYKWRGGICIPDAKDVALYKQVLFILAGPVLSVIIMSGLCF